MTLEERLDFCKICANRKNDFKIGLLCGLTLQKPDFEDECDFFIQDEKEAERKLNLKLDAAGPARSQNSSLKPGKNINYGAFLTVSGLLVLVFLSFLFGVLILTAGVSFLIRGYSQKKVLAENRNFNEKLKKK